MSLLVSECSTVLATLKTDRKIRASSYFQSYFVSFKVPTTSKLSSNDTLMTAATGCIDVTSLIWRHGVKMAEKINHGMIAEP